jgi:hypothetical protein
MSQRHPQSIPEDISESLTMTSYVLWPTKSYPFMYQDKIALRKETKYNLIACEYFPSYQRSTHVPL